MPVSENNTLLNVTQVTFIDTSLPDYQTLIEGLPEGMEVVLVSPDQDGVQVMAEWAATHSNYDAIHMLGHGTNGAQQLGSATLSTDTLSQYQAQLAQIGASLSDDGDLLLYGCNVAADQTGVDFIGKLAQITGADIAASEDLTGAESLGGDWVLEYVTNSQNDTVPPIILKESNILLNQVSYGFDTQFSTDINAAFGESSISTTYQDLKLTAYDYGFFGMPSVGSYSSDHVMLDDDGKSGSDRYLAVDGEGVGNGGSRKAVGIEKNDGGLFSPISVEIGIFTYRSDSANQSEPYQDTLTVFAYNSSGTEVGKITYSPVYDDDYITLNFSNPTAGYTRDNGYFNSAPTIISTGSFSNISELRVQIGHNTFYMDNLVISNTPLADTTAPSFESSTPSTTNVSTTSLDLTADIDEGGKIYYVVMADGADAPSAEEVKAGTGASGAVAVTSGNTTVTSGAFSNTFSVSGLTASTAYDIYVVAEDDEGTPNLQTSPTKVDVTTATPPNAAPTISNAPSDITLTEDTAGNIDLSAITFADTNNDTLTVTLTVSAGTFSAPADGSTTGAGVTENLASSTVITLVGKAGDINTYLDTAANIQYTGATNVSGEDAATITISASDGNGGSLASNPVINLDITAVNDAPTVATNGAITVNEGSVVIIANTALNEGDPDDEGAGLTYTVTTAPSNGQLFLDTDSDGEVDSGEALTQNSSFTQQDINDSKVKYLHDGSETTSDSFGFSLADGGEDSAAALTGQTFSITVTPQNDAPVLGGTINATWTENTQTGANVYSGNSIYLFSNPTLTDGDTTTDFNGATLTVGLDTYQTGDLISLPSAAGSVTYDQNTAVISVSGVAIGSLSGGSMADLAITFNTSASKSDIEAVMEVIAYVMYSNDDPTAGNRTVTATFNDKANADTDTGALTDTLTGTLTISTTNDTPTLTTTTATPNFTEGDNAVTLFSNTAVDTIESGQTITGITLTVSNVTDGSDELLLVDGDTISLTNANTGATSINAVGYSVVVSNNTATVTLTKTDSSTNWQSYIDGLKYQNTSDNPSDTNDRTITLTALTDNGGTDNNGVATATLSNASVVNITAVNDAPTDIGLSGTTVAQSAGANAVIGSLSSTDVDSSSFTYTLVAGTGDTNNASFNISGSTLQANNASILNEGSYSVRVQSNDGSQTYEEAFTITVSDDIAPTVSASHISVSGGSGTNGAFIIGDTVTATWDNSASGENNSDSISSVTVDFSEFGGGSAVSASNSNGTWTATYTIVSGNINATTANVSVTATDDASNPTTMADTDNATLDNQAPAAPSAPDLEVSSDSGSSGADDLTKDDTPTLTGTAEANSTVTLYDTNGTTVLGSTTADTQGSWSITTSTLADGDHTLTAKATDAVGNTSTASSSLVVTVDTTAPAAPLTLELASASSSSDNITNSTTPLISGSAEANSTVTLYDGTAVLGSTTADGSGKWSITTSTLADGAHSLTATATDAAGNTSSASSALSVTIDTAAPGIQSVVVPDTTMKVGDTVTVTITVADDSGDEYSNLSGTVGGFTLSNLSRTGSTTYTAQFTVTEGGTDVAAGSDIPVSLTLQDSAGNTSETYTTAISQTADVIDANSPSSSAPTLASASDSGVSNSDQITNDKTATINGTAEAGASVSVHVAGSAKGSATVDGNGDWNFTFADADLSEGNNDITVVITDAAGNTSTASSALTLTLDTTAPVPINDTAPVNEDDDDALLTTTLNGANLTVQVNDTGTNTASPVTQVNGESSKVGQSVTGSNGGLFTVNANGTVSFDPNDAFESLAQGDSATTSVTITVQDDAGNTADSTVTVTVNGNNDAPDSADITKSVGYNSSYKFQESDFSFNDVDTNDSLDHITITGLPSKGTVSFDGTAITATNYQIDAANIGLLTYKPASGGTGTDYTSFTFTVSDDKTGTSSDYTVTIDVGSPPPPVPTVVVDGATVTTQTQRNSQGNTVEVVTVAPVTSNRQDTDSTSSNADLPFQFEPGNANNVVTTLSLPTGLGVQVLSSNTASSQNQVSNFTSLVQDIEGDSEDSQTAQALGTTFLSTVPTTNTVFVNSIKVTSSGSSINEPVVITGTADTNNTEAFVIDLRSVTNTHLQLDNIEFASIIGSATVSGGAGQNYVHGDSNAQYIKLGADDDELHGGGGDDIIGSEGGDDLLYGDSGDDIVFGGTGHDTLYGGTGNDVLQGGQTTQGSLAFSLNSAGEIVTSFTASDVWGDEVQPLTFSGDWYSQASMILDGKVFGMDLSEGNIASILNAGLMLQATSEYAFLSMDADRLQMIASSYQSIFGELVSASDLSSLAGSQFSLAELANITAQAWVAEQEEGFDDLSAEQQVSTLLTSFWQQSDVSESAISEVLTLLTNGLSIGELFLGLAQSQQAKDKLTTDQGLLQLVATSDLSETALSTEIGNDFLYGGAGDDTLIGGHGNDLLDGGEGIDTAVQQHMQAEYVIAQQEDGSITLTYQQGAYTEVDTLVGVEWVQFSDRLISTTDLL